MNLSSLGPDSLQLILGFLNTMAVVLLLLGSRRGRGVAVLMLVCGLVSSALLVSSPEFEPNWVLVLLGVALGAGGGWLGDPPPF